MKNHREMSSSVLIEHVFNQENL